MATIHPNMAILQVINATLTKVTASPYIAPILIPSVRSSSTTTSSSTSSSTTTTTVHSTTTSSSSTVQVINATLTKVTASPYIAPFSSTLLDIIVVTLIMALFFLLFRSTTLLNKKFVLLMIALYIIILQLFLTPYEYTTQEILPNGTVVYIVYTSYANVVQMLDVLAGIGFIAVVIFLILDFIRRRRFGDDDDGEVVVIDL